MARRLFCELGPAAYRISVAKQRLLRRVRDALSRAKFARGREKTPLPVTVYRHNSLIRRTLGNVDRRLQENKAVNLALAAPKIDGILIRPGETFSFWRLVGSCTAKKGYREGLTISSGRTSSGIGGGMCQMTNLIHFMALHSPLTITEHHHHDGLDLFPDFGRTVPFGTGTSVMYNYLDYRLRNDTPFTFQLLVHSDGEYLRGELRADGEMRYRYHIQTENERFVRRGGEVFRRGEVYRLTVDPVTGETVRRELIKRNDARVMYDTSGLEISEE